MSDNKKQDKGKQEFSYQEYLDTFAPKRKSDEDSEDFPREAFIEILRKDSRPNQLKRDSKKLEFK